MLSSITRYFSAPVASRAYNTVSGTFRARLARAPTRASDHTTGRGTAAFNEREAALENKAVRDHETINAQRLRDDAKRAAEAPLGTAAKAPRNSGLKTAAAAGSSAEVESLQKQIDALQAQLNQIKK